MMPSACLLVAGCYGSVPFVGGDGHAVGDTGWEPGIDTTIDPDPDSSLDPVPDFHHDGGADSMPDTGGDGVPDGIPCWPGTAGAGGVCSVVDRCGCPPGEWCTWNLSAGCLLYEECWGGEAGTLDVEAECSGHMPGECRPGSDCLPYGSTSLCHEWCMDDSDCSIAGTECNVPVSFSLPSPCEGVATAPYMVCSIACPPDAGCDPLAIGTCGPANACYWDPECDDMVCEPAGTGLPGDPCDGIGCAEGSGCYWTASDPEVFCYQFCDLSVPAPSCSTGTCRPAGSETHPDLGVCLPP